MPIALNSADRRVIAIAVVVAGISLAIGLKYFSHAFPEASIEFRVNRDDSTPVALKFLAERGWSVGDYRHAAVFDYDDDAKVYLERTQGLERMNSLTKGPIHLWHWSHRWFKPQQKEEYRVAVTPAGEVVGFDHEIAESAAGANLDLPAARALAEKFLADVMRRDLAGLEFIDSTNDKRPARTDYSFTWKQKDVNLGDGSLRIEVGVDGDQVASYHEFVKVPEAWSRDYARLRSRNEAANFVDEVPWAVLCIAGLALLIQHLRRRNVPVYLSLGFGLVTALLYFFSQLNSFSLAEFGYRTTDSYSSFVSGFLVENLLVALVFGALIFLLVASTEPVYRESYPGFISIRRYLSWQGLRTRSFLLANVVGIAMTFFFFAYQTVFYLAANRLGAWAPAEVPFTDLLNTRFPWVMVLFFGFFPAVSEEIQFRAFAIPFLQKVLKWRPAAVVLPAFIWGFLHAGYPNQPFFIRGLEVGFGGIIIGLIMLRFGVLATLIWHYSVDALYTAFLLLRSPNHYLMLSGGLSAGIMLVPLLVAAACYFKTGTFSKEERLLNTAENPPAPLPQEALAAEAPLVYRPLSSYQVGAALAFALIFAGVASNRVYRFGKGIELHISSKDALRIADNYLDQRKVDPAKYRHVVWINDNVESDSLHYLAQRKTVEQADQIYRQATKLTLWAVRYFRPLEKEEYQVYVDPITGQVFGFHHTLPEDAPGAALTADQARALAEQAVKEHGYPLDGFDLQSSDVSKRKAREDYTLTWQAKPGDPRNVGDAHYRLKVEIAGDQVVGFSRFFKLPEDWLRAEEASTVWNKVLLTINILGVMVLVAGGLILFVNLVRAGRMPWKRSAKFGVLIAIVGFLAALNNLSQVYMRYDTSMPLAVWKTFIAVSLTVAPLVEGLLAWLIIGAALSLYPDAWNLWKARARGIWRRDALLATVLSLAAGAGLVRVDQHLTSVFHAHAMINDELFSPLFSTQWPAAAFFLSALTHTFFYTPLLAFAVYIFRQGWRQRAWWLWAGLTLELAALGPAAVHSAAGFALGWLMEFLPLLVAAGIVGFFLRNNVLAYVMAVFCTQVAVPIVELLTQQNSFFRQNGAVLAVGSAVVLIWMIWNPGGAEAPPAVSEGA